MLIDFTIENYRSFKDTATLSMEAEAYKSTDVLIINDGYGHNLLPAVGVFGQNASGKSNIIKAFVYMINAILTPNYSIEPINQGGFQPFMLNIDSISKPSHFEITLYDNKLGVEYNYGFEAGVSGVSAEWLVITSRPNRKNKTTRVVFERSGSTYEFGELAKDMDNFKDRVSNIALAVNIFAALANKTCVNFVELVKSAFCIIMGDNNDTAQLAYELCYNDKHLMEQTIEFINQLDVDIKSLSINKLDSNDGSLPKAPNWIKGQFTGSSNYIVSSMHDMYDSSGHNTGRQRFFSFQEQESLGTRKLFGLAAVLLDSLNKGKIVVVDELGSSLHPFLTRRLVELFQDAETNKNGAQLIFTSHETFLLASSPYNNLDLRRDQIWFTDKSTGEASVLRCLSEYKTRSEADLMKRYLGGRFGAVPIIKG